MMNRCNINIWEHFKSGKIAYQLNFVKFQCKIELLILLANFELRAQVYVEIDKIRKELRTDPENKLPSLLATINDLFSTLEASMRQVYMFTCSFLLLSLCSPLCI